MNCMVIFWCVWDLVNYAWIEAIQFVICAIIGKRKLEMRNNLEMTNCRLVCDSRRIS